MMNLNKYKNTFDIFILTMYYKIYIKFLKSDVFN